MKDAENMNLGELLNYAQQFNIAVINSSECEKGCHVPYHTKTISIGIFRMQSHSHDTGDSVVVYVINNDDPYCILNGTYWKRSGYDFNKFHREHGAWDTSFEQAIGHLAKTIQSHIDVWAKKEKDKQLKEKTKVALRKEEVERLFI